MKSNKIIMVFIGLIITAFVFILLRGSLKDDNSPVIFTEPGAMASIPELKNILSYREIDSVLNTLTKIPFENIDQEYLDYSGYSKTAFRDAMQGRFFYKLTESDLSKKLVGKFIVAEFMPKDKRSRKLHPEIGTSQYFCMEKYILHRLLDLILALKKNGYNEYAFIINDGYRYPSFNEYKGGASSSQHTYGRAIDLAIGDINKDGRFDEATDKNIVLRIVENDIIKNSGGVGRYINSNVVHFDTRGFYSRWE